MPHHSSFLWSVLGNMWGTCANGTEGLGCGYPETFRNCADIRIVSSSSGLPPQFVNTLSHAALSREYSMKSGPMLSYPTVVKYVIIFFFQSNPGENFFNVLKRF